MHPETGTVLYEKNADERLGIASTTKIMTALVVLEHCALDEPVEILPEYTAVEGSSMYLRAGETYTVEELLYGLMLSSGNDAAVGPTEAFGPGARETGVNRQGGPARRPQRPPWDRPARARPRACPRARARGPPHRAFHHPPGLAADGHYSTARDMAKLACAAMENETFRTIVSTRSAVVNGQTLVNHNRLLRSYDGAVGVKTGYTKTTGRTLVSCAQRGTTQFVCVTLSDPDDWNDHTHLLDWAFENYEYRCVAGDTPVYAVPVLSATVELCAAVPERPAYLLVRPDDQVALKAELPRFAFAPVEQGTQAGTLTATGPDGQSVTVPLCYAEPAALDPDVKITPLARLGRLWTHACRYFSSYYPVS